MAAFGGVREKCWVCNKSIYANDPQWLFNGTCANLALRRPAASAGHIVYTSCAAYKGREFVI